MPITQWILAGLIFEAIGVIVLVRGSWETVDRILRHLGKSVPNDWNERVMRARRNNNIISIIGATLLVIGFTFQYYGLLCTPDGC